MLNENFDRSETPLGGILLDVKNLSVYLRQDQNLREKLLLNRISFQVRRGKFTALIGRSGIGKTLTLKAIVGFLTPPDWRLEGDINLYKNGQKKIALLKNGRYLPDNLKALRGKTVFTIFQGPDSHLHPTLSIKWQIGEMIRPSKPWKNTGASIKKWLSDVGLDAGEAKKYPHQLAQGQRQRALMAMARGCKDLVMADEPTSALDDDTKKQIIQLFLNLRKERKLESLLLVTHDVNLIRSLFEKDDEIIILDKTDGQGVGVIDALDRAESELPDHIIESRKLTTRYVGEIPLVLKSHPLLNPRRIENMRTIVSSKSIGDVILQVKDLRQTYSHGMLKKPRVVLDGIDLDIREGEFLGIVGKSGCGKTTLIKSLARLLPNTQGRIFYCRPHRKPQENWKVDLIKIQPDGSKPDSPIMMELRKEIQVIFQNSASIFNPRMTIGEILTETVSTIFGVRNQNERRNMITRSLLDLGICKSEGDIEEILKKYPSELSGGEKQRLAIGRVFLLRPKLIFADEPFADQDIITKIEILRMMNRIRELNSTAFVIVSHERDLIAQTSDRIATIANGGIKEIMIPSHSNDLEKAEFS